MRCNNCNAELPEGAKFCGKCGTPVVEQEETVHIFPTSQTASNQVQEMLPPQPSQRNLSRKKKKGNQGLIIAIVIMCILLVAIVGLGVYFFIVNPDALDTLFSDNSFVKTEKELDEDDDKDKKDKKNKDDDETSDEDEEDAQLDGEGIPKEEDAKQNTVKDYENPDYMNGPKALGRSDRVSVLDFVAPVPDDSIEAPADGSIPVQYFDPSIHEYQLFVEDVTYYEASQKCEALGGHLATIVCKEEQDLIDSLLRQGGYNQSEEPYQIWLGAYVDQATGFTAWCTDEGIGVSNWKAGEPTFTDPDTGKKEEHIMIVYNPETDQWEWTDETYDVSDKYAGRIAYLCEWEVITDENYYEDLKTRK